jgi:acetylornithine deacetylase
VTDVRDDAMLILGDLVGFPTVTTESNLDLIAYVTSRLEPLGADIRITRDETGAHANLLATIGPVTDGGVVLSGHSDVVPAEEPDWTGAPFVAMRREQRIYGRGTVDMKGFIACALAMAPVFADTNLSRPVHIAVTYGEEVGCKGAPLLIEDLISAGIRPAAAIVGEPTEMRIVEAHKGMHEYTTHIVGLEGHGSLPAQAVNAVQYGARYIGKLMELAAELEKQPPDDSPYDPPHTTISVGSIHGGVAHNIVAGECLIEWEMRPVVRADTALVLDGIGAYTSQLQKEMQAISPAASIETRTVGAVGGLQREGISEAVKILMALLDNPQRSVAAFGTEAGLYQEAGIPAAVCGPGSIDVAHKPDEYVSIDQLERCLQMMKGLGETLAKPE